MSLPLNWPVSLDALANPGATTERDDPGFELDLVVSRIHDLLEAMEARFGVGSANGTPVADRVYGGTGAGTAGYRQIANNDVASGAGLAISKLADIGAGNIIRSNGSGNVAGKLLPADMNPVPTGTVTNPMPNLIANSGAVSAGTASITFSSIPTTYAHLRLIALMRANGGTSGEDIAVQFNGATSDANHYSQILIGLGTATPISQETAGATSCRIGLMPGAGVTGSIYACVVMDIPCYRVAGKVIVWSSVCAYAAGAAAANLHTRVHTGLWGNGFTVSSLALSGVSNNLAVGCQAWLYGFN